MTLKVGLALAGFAVVLLARSALASTLTLCGVVDQSPQDLDPRPGFVLANCALANGGTLSALAQETVTATMDVIHLSPSFVSGTNPGEVVAFNTYNFLGGPGFEESSFAGQLENQPGAVGPSVGGENFTQLADASTFSGPAAVASFAAPAAGTTLPIAVTGLQKLLGNYAAGPGTLTGTINFNSGVGQRFHFPESEDLIAQVTPVPEPGALILFSTCFAALIGYKIGNRKPE